MKELRPHIKEVEYILLEETVTTGMEFIEMDGNTKIELLEIFI